MVGSENHWRGSITLNGARVDIVFREWGRYGGVQVHLDGDTRPFCHSVSKDKPMDYLKVVDEIFAIAERVRWRENVAATSKINREKTEKFFVEHGLTTSYSVGRGWHHHMSESGDVRSEITLRNEDLIKILEVMKSTPGLDSCGEITLYFHIDSLEKMLPLLEKTAEAFPK